MATAKPHRPLPPARRAGPRRHLLRNLVLALLGIVALATALGGRWFAEQALVATAYGARIACSCHYIAGRGLADCRKDFEPGMTLVLLSDNLAAHAITARIPFMASQTAIFRSGPGCQLQSWAP